MGHDLRGEQPERPPGAAQYSGAAKAKDEEIGVKKEWSRAANDAVGQLYSGHKPGLRDIEVCVRGFLEAAAKDGWRLVPMVATPDMVKAGGTLMDEHQHPGVVWGGMHDAAPVTPPGGPEE
jgi:hypothetical protein